MILLMILPFGVTLIADILVATFVKNKNNFFLIFSMSMTRAIGYSFTFSKGFFGPFFYHITDSLYFGVHTFSFGAFIMPIIVFFVSIFYSIVFLNIDEEKKDNS